MTDGKLPLAILQIEGTNCDEELFRALATLGADPEMVHLKQFEGRDVSRDERRRLGDYRALFLPGGFSAGDYVRAGAVLGARLRGVLGRDLEDFLRSGNLVGGICNGFQALVEIGLLPGRPGGFQVGSPQAALNTNDSDRFECRPTFCRWDGGTFPPLRNSLSPGTVWEIPSAHGEGKLILSGEANATLPELEENGQVLFRWVGPDGQRAGYPWNPNGSVGDVAGITNREGNVFGLMPHPERTFWTRQSFGGRRTEPRDGLGDGGRFLSAIVSYLQRRP